MKSYSAAADLRTEELARATQLRLAEVLKAGRGVHDEHHFQQQHSQQLPYRAQSTYVRGLAEFEKVRDGVSNIGGMSRFDLIQPDQNRTTNPIVGGEAYGVGIEPKPPPGRSKFRYDPILQCYPDELQMRHRQASDDPNQPDTTPDDDEPPVEVSSRTTSDPERKERYQRTKNWTPGKPKGGRTYKEASIAKSSSPIIGEALTPDQLSFNLRLKASYEKKMETQYNSIFQVHYSPRTELQTLRAEQAKKETFVQAALSRRLVREGAYDPIALRDRRTGEPVGPLEVDENLENKVGMAKEFGNVSRSGHSVAIALGSDRYGEHDDDTTQRERRKEEFDNVKLLLENESRIANGEHDLEYREVEPTAVQALLDERYAAYADMHNAVAHARPRVHVPSPPADHFSPRIGAADIIGNDTMRTWAPIEPEKHAYEYNDGVRCSNVFSPYAEQPGEGQQRNLRLAGHSRRTEEYLSNNIRPQDNILWPEERNEFSHYAQRVERAKKGM